MKHLLTLAVTSLLATTAFADPIHSAVWNGDLEGVQAELDNGVDVDEKDDLWGRTPLHIAAEEGHKEIAELLIAAGADVNAKDSVGFTPLHEAAWKGHKEVVELLIDNGADVNAKSDWFERTPLHDAVPNIKIPANKEAKEIVELLIAKGADMNAKDGVLGDTILHYAASQGHKEIAKLLIAKGADVNVRTDGGGNPRDGHTPLDWAILSKQTEITDLLRKHGGKTSEQLKAEGK